MFPPKGANPDSKNFDISLLFLLLTNICGLSPPRGKDWNHKPHPTDHSLESNLLRIKSFRNELYGHVTTTGINTPTFNALWRKISGALCGLGLDKTAIDRLKKEPSGEDYIDLLAEWYVSELSIKLQLEDMRRSLTELQQAQTNSKDLEGQREKHRESEILKKLANIDSLEKIVRRHADSYVEGTRLSIIATVESWLNDRSCPNRVMVISGNPGMGKSVISAVMCEKRNEKRNEAWKLAGRHFC